MTKRDLHFFRLDANQAAVIVGLFETLSITSLYFTVGAVVGVLTEGIKAGVPLDDYWTVQKYADQKLFAGMGALFLAFLIPLIFPLLLLIGAVKGIRCMMLPWIIVGWMRAIVGTFCFIAVFAFPIGSCAQVFLFVSLSIYYAMTVYSLNAVCCSYSHMRLIESQNIGLVNGETVPYHNF